MAKHRKRHQRNSYTRETKLQILNYFRENGENKYKTCKEFNLNSKTLSTWIKEEAKILQMPAGKRANRYRLPRYPDVEESLYTQYLEQKKQGLKTGKAWLRSKAKEIMDELHPGAKFKFSSHWFSRFKERYGLAFQLQDSKFQNTPHANTKFVHGGRSYMRATVITVAPCSSSVPSERSEKDAKCLCSFCVGDEPLSEMTTQLTSEAHNTAEKGIKSEGATCTTNDKQKEMSKQSNKMTERETMYMEEKISETAFAQSLDEYEQKKELRKVVDTKMSLL